MMTRPPIRNPQIAARPAVDAGLEALEEQVVLYRRLAKLAEQQHEHVQQGQTEELLAVLAARQQVLDLLNVQEQTVAPIRRDWSGYLSRLSPALRQRAEDAMSESRQLLEEITTADRNDAMVLQQRKLNLGRQISQARAARQVNRTYATAAYGQKASSLDVSK